MAQSTYSLIFDGTGYLTTGVTLIPATADWTIAGWIKYTSLSGVQSLVGQRSSGVQGRFFAGSINATMYMQAGDVIDVSGSSTLSTGVWYHFAFRRSGTSWTMYLNGVLEGSGSSSGAVEQSSLHIGGANTTDFLLSGQIDFLSIYNSALSTGNISSLAAGTIDPLTLSPIAFWSMEEGTGTTTADTSGNSHTATFHGGVTWSSLNDVPVPLQSGGGTSVSRTATDAPTLSESISRGLILFRSTSESITTSESIGRVAVDTRTAIDSPILSESLTRILQSFRVTTETPTLSQSVSYIAGKILTATESISLSDNATRVLANSRITSESIIISESLSRLCTLIRNTTESLSTSESIARVISSIRSLTESISTSDIATFLSTKSRSTTENITLLESLTRTQILSRSVTDHLTFTEVVTSTGVVVLTLIVQGSYSPYLYVSGNYDNIISVNGSETMPIATDIDWRRGQKRTLVVTIDGTESMSGWAAILEWSKLTVGTVVLSIVGVIDSGARTISFAIESIDTASLYENELEWNVWRTDASASDSPLAYGTVFLSGNPR